MKRLLGLVIAAILVAGCADAGGAALVGPGSSSPAGGGAGTTAGRVTTPGTKASPLGPSLAHLIGQKLVVRMEGTAPSADLLGRIERGEVGGVILMGFNITTAAEVRNLTGALQAAAARGHQPPLLIAVDQEGGAIKRIAWAPPTLSPPQIGDLKSSSVARTQGELTGAALRDLGINVDFAPVADVPSSTDSFMFQQGRTYSFSSTRTATLANAFASGLRSEGVVPTLKHFPGIGFAARNTDAYVVTIGASKSLLAAGLRPYRTGIADDIPLVMLSNATYTAYDPANAAGWSHAIGVDLLRGELGFRGVTITDSLDGTAHSRGVTTKSLALKAAGAGTDMILMTGSEATTKAVFTALLRAAEAGTLPKAMLRSSYDRIEALKAAI